MNCHFFHRPILAALAGILWVATAANSIAQSFHIAGEDTVYGVNNALFYHEITTEPSFNIYNDKINFVAWMAGDPRPPFDSPITTTIINADENGNGGVLTLQKNFGRLGNAINLGSNLALPHTYNLMIAARNDSGEIAEKALALTVEADPRFIAPPKSISGFVGLDITNPQTISANYSFLSSEYQFKLADGQPFQTLAGLDVEGIGSPAEPGGGTRILNELVIKGRPTQSGHFDVTLTLGGSNGNPVLVSDPFTIDIIAPEITSDLVANAASGTPFSYKIETNLPKPDAYSISGFPAGWTVSEFGVITGTPNPSLAGQSFTGTVSAHHSTATASAILRIDVGFKVVVVTDFGADSVIPPAGNNVGLKDTVQTYEAPTVVYLNRNFEEIPTIGAVGDLYDNDPSNDDTVAHFRALNVGYTINGGGQQTDAQLEGDKFKFVAAVDKDLRLEWLWELEYAVIVESDVNIPAAGTDPPPGSGTGNPVPYIGRAFYKKDADFAAQIDRVADSDSGGFRYASGGYDFTKGGRPRSVQGDERYRKFSPGGGDNTASFGNGVVTEAEHEGFTIAFWGKIDNPLATGRDQVFAQFRSTSNPGPFLRIGVRPNGRFFVEEHAPELPGGQKILAEVPGDAGFDWHHWAVVLDYPANGSRREVKVYRDTMLVTQIDLGSDQTYIPGILRVGRFDVIDLGNGPNPALPNDTLDGGLNNVSTAVFAASDSDVVAHANGPAHVTGPLADPISAGSVKSGIRIFHFESESFSPFPKTFPHNPEPTRVLIGDRAGDRVATQPFTIDSWLRIKWLWEGQVRYRFDATAGGLGETAAQFDGQAFVREYDAAGTVKRTTFATQPNSETWVEVGSRVEVGAFYRTADNCFTLDDFPNQQAGDLVNLGSDISILHEEVIVDAATGEQRVARFYPVGSAAAPTEIHWLYRPTIFRAEIPIGGSFDALNPDSQLVPPLCDGAELRTGDQGPSDRFVPVGRLADGATGNPTRWDRLAKRLFPVQPGSYQIQWPDANDPGKEYKIEIVSGYPGEEVILTSERELPEPPYGRREGVAPDYVTGITLASVGSWFPAAPGAHYRHYLDPDPSRQPPTKLDLEATDQWAFQELTYSDRSAGARVDPALPGTGFSTTGEGRSVVLYSFRPNPDEIATGNLDKENLAVRVVRSVEKVPLAASAPELVLGRRSLQLSSLPEVGVFQRPSTGSTSIDTGDNFLIDFWLNAQELLDGEGPGTIVQMGNGGEFSLWMDPMASEALANYRGMSVINTFSLAGAAWRHVVVHAHVDPNTGETILDLWIDGVRESERAATSTLSTSSPINTPIGSSPEGSPLLVRRGAHENSVVRVDHLRLFTKLPSDELDSGEVGQLRSVRHTSLRSIDPDLVFDFEAPPVADAFDNGGTLTGVALGLIDDVSENWAQLDLQEVATRIDSPLDAAGFGGSGYVMNAVSNYNANLYDRNAEVGAWGPIFPVNHGNLYTEPNRRLEVAYYENPYLADEALHPNVAWPYEASLYDEVVYPIEGPHSRKAIYIASRVGSEGVDQDGRVQEVFDLAKYSDFAIYNQPDNELPGYNPNEEHAIAVPSGRAALKIKNLGDDIANNPPLAAYALQNEINITDTLSPEYTSDPWVLVQVLNLSTGEPEMAAYQVFKTRPGTIPFPRPTDQAVANADGLEYESAPIPEDRFLAIDPEEVVDFAYAFDYPVFAGDLLIPPYPLNVVIGNVGMPDARGGNIMVNGDAQRTLWRDVNGNAWIVSGGGGRFFHQFFYPMRGDFYLPEAESGQPVAWLPTELDNGSFIGDNRRGVDELDDHPKPLKIGYTSSWRSDYPKLKRGETLAYQGGEYFNDNPGANGLPAVVAMKAAEVVYDVANRRMVISEALLHDYSARVIRPLDRLEVPFTVAEMAAAGFTPADRDKVFIVAERWYFKELPGSLQRRFYFDSLAEKLVFRGLLNGKESGDPDLTAGSDPINVLEPNVLTQDEFARMMALVIDPGWETAVREVFSLSQNPHGVPNAATSETDPIYLSGLIAPPADHSPELIQFWVEGSSGFVPTAYNPDYAPLASLGVGSALVPSPNLLINPANESRFITIAENNRSELNGAPVSLHVIEIIPDRYRGAIKVIEAADAFSEKITLQHNGEFGANTGDLYYEWWIRDAAPLDVVANEILPDGTLKETDGAGRTLWQEYIPEGRESLTGNLAKHRGLHSIVFEGRPDIVLADKLVLMRYRHVFESDWKLVPFEFPDAVDAWAPGFPSPAPFQWAGAANSPQLQADGSKRYIPQLVMGWVKRVLDRINPYEARYTDFFGNESPAAYSSQIQIAGAPFAGKVALNPDKNVIENVGLIELYETVLARAKELSIDNSTNANHPGGVQQALLLAATRLAVLYELLAREAYSDAQDSTITVGTDDGLSGVASFTHAFQNMEASLQHEEMALLRGTDFRKSYPVYNRMFWNYAKGLGEAAYNVNYNIYDENTDGFINEDDARSLYPQGHGDSWGHFLSALGMHYELLQDGDFTWLARSELYSLMQNVLEVDYLDEKTFAKLAAGKARAGRDIVRGTYRLHYTSNPDGQWQGYTDSADPSRAWGVSEWGMRAGQGAYFDWAVANALLPDDASESLREDFDDDSLAAENLDAIERSAAESEIGEVASGLFEIQNALDEANGGVNPLGFDADALAFDLYPRSYDGGVVTNKTHFEQIYDRAVATAGNAKAALDFAARADNKLRRIADDTDALIVEALRQDIDYRNRLIEIFGRPYDGTIGFGKVYPEGYEGPDTLLYAYLDRTRIEQIIPPNDTGGEETLNFVDIQARITGIADNKLKGIYSTVYGGVDGARELQTSLDAFINGNNYLDPTATFTMPIQRASAYAFQADTEQWGQRTSYGTVQRALEEMLAEEIALKGTIDEYIGFLQDMERIALLLENEIERLAIRNDLGKRIRATRGGITAAINAAEIVKDGFETFGEITEEVGKAGVEGIPKSVFDIASAARAALLSVKTSIKIPAQVSFFVTDQAIRALNIALSEITTELERDQNRTHTLADLEAILIEWEATSGSDGPLRALMGAHMQNLEIKRQEYFTALSEGFRLLDEREAFNKILAAKAQKNRYQDMMLRLSRNETTSKYQSAYNNAARYTWLAARAYDYETSLDPGDPAAPGSLLDKIVKERQLGLWDGGKPQSGQGGLAEILNQLNGNFQVLKGQLGLNNPQAEVEKISLRAELFRIAPQGGANNDIWENVLKTRIVPDLTRMPEFVRHCRPFSTPVEGAHPGLVIRFSSQINNGVNFFGNRLEPGDHAYSTANFATKVRGFGVWLENYNDAGLSTTPRAYLVPVGNDYLRTSSAQESSVRMWSVLEQRIPTPFVINQSNLTAPDFIPTLNGVDGGFAELRRHGDFRMYHDDGGAVDESELIYDSRLIGRSVWNSEWLLIIPGAGLHSDPSTGLQQLAENVSDIKLHFRTYSHQGQ